VSINRHSSAVVEKVVDKSLDRPMSKNRRTMYYRRMSDGNLPVLLSTRQAAAVLGVTVRTIQRFADAGELAAAYRFDGRRGAYLFHEADVRDLAKRRERVRTAA
jgi:excisionase family DNA binding protein